VSDDDELLYLNGVDATTGQYAVSPLPLAAAYAYARGERPDPERLKELEYLQQVREGTYAFEGNTADPAEVGWGVLIRPDEPDEVQQEVRRLYQHRAGSVPAEYLHWLEYPVGGSGQDHSKWLQNHEVAVGAPEPEKVPFYLLVVGGPDRIPYSFIQGLSPEYAVGRLDFTGPDGKQDVAALRAYIDALIAYESPGHKPATARRLALFAPRHEFNEFDVTHASVRRLVRPLAGLPPEEGGEAKPGVAQEAGWGDPLLAVAQDATKDRLATLLKPAGGERPPALLFTASHGIVYPRGHEDQRSRQGALLCQEWGGLGSAKPEQYFTAADLPAEATLHGMIPFIFACFGGGTPTHDSFLQVEGQAHELADTPFTAALPQMMLAAGALACFSHVDRAWASSFHKRLVNAQNRPFRVGLKRLMQGHTIGFAMRFFFDRYAALSTTLASAQSRVLNNKAKPDDTPEALTWRWVERNDAEGYALLGDPAARLRVADLS
jgi:hypothetical protein